MKCVYKALMALWDLLWWLRLTFHFVVNNENGVLRPKRWTSFLYRQISASLGKTKVGKILPRRLPFIFAVQWDIGKKLCVNFPVGRSAPGAARPISFLIRSAQEIIFSRRAFSHGIIRGTYCSSGVGQGLSRWSRSRGAGVNYCDGNWKPSSTSPVWLPELLLSDPEPPLFPRLESVEPGSLILSKTRSSLSSLSITLPPRLWSFLAHPSDLPRGSFNLASERFGDILRVSS